MFSPTTDPSYYRSGFRIQTECKWVPCEWMCVCPNLFSNQGDFNNKQTNKQPCFVYNQARDNSREAPSVANSWSCRLSSADVAPKARNASAGECEYRSGFLYLFIYLFNYLDGWMHGQAARLGLVLVCWLVTRLSIFSASTCESDR